MRKYLSSIYNTKNILSIITLSLIYIFLPACNTNSKEQKNDEGQKIYQGLEQVTTELPDSTGYLTFKRTCIICHTLKYIEMQPNFPRKTWEKIVDKMRKSYGAPLDTNTAIQMVDYLMKIKGKK
jgi:cytochrome c5